MNAASDTLVIRVRRETRRATVIEASGDLDHVTADSLRAALRRTAGNRIVVLDAGKIEFCDVAGLRILLEADALAGAAGCTLHLAAPSPALTRLLELTDTFDVFEIYPSVGTALGH